jgi:hypothetical protein
MYCGAMLVAICVIEALQTPYGIRIDPETLVFGHVGRILRVPADQRPINGVVAAFCAKHSFSTTACGTIIRTATQTVAYRDNQAVLVEWNVTIDGAADLFHLLEGETLGAATRMFCYYHGCDLESIYKLELLIQQVITRKMQILSNEVSRMERRKASLSALLNNREEFYFYSLNDIDKKIYERFFMNANGQPTIGSRFNGRPGKFIELGGGDGVTFSNSLFFEQALGWSGILIEPVEVQYKALVRNRPPSDCFHGAVCTSKGTVRIEGRGMMAHVLRADGSSVIKDRAGDNGDHVYNNGTIEQGGDGLGAAGTAVKEVGCNPLSFFIERSNITQVNNGVAYFDLLSIDVEGSELAVLQSINWTVVRVHVILIELPAYNVTQDAMCRSLLLMKVGCPPLSLSLLSLSSSLPFFTPLGEGLRVSRADHRYGRSLGADGLVRSSGSGTRITKGVVHGMEA